MKKLFTLSAVLLSMVMILAGCSNSTAPSPGSVPDDSASASDTQIVIGMCNANLAEPWNVQMDDDVATAAAKYGNVVVKFKDAGGDSLLQRAQIEEFVNEGVDILIVSPVEATPLTEPVTAAFDSGIPVFLVGRMTNNESYTQYIGSDEFSLGYAAGKWIVDNYNGNGAKVVQLDGLMTSTPGYERHEGFNKALEGSDVEVIFQADCGWDEAHGRSEMESVLAVHDRIDVVFGGNDPTAHGAYVAAASADRADGIAFIGIDGLAHEGMAYVKDGIFAMTIYDATGGDIAVDNAIRYLNGDTLEKNIFKDAIVLEKDTLETGGTVVELPGGIK